MKRCWVLAALLSAALVVGCSDRTPQNTQNYEEGTPAAPSEPTGQQGQQPTAEDASRVPPASTGQDGSTAAARRGGAPAARATTGARPASAHVPLTRDGAPAAESPAPAAATAPAWREVTVPAGTALPLELLTALSSETAQVERLYAPAWARLSSSMAIRRSRPGPC